MILIQRLKIGTSIFCAKLDIWPSHVLCVTRINVGRVVAGAGAGANPSSRTFLAESEGRNFGRRRRPESEVTNFLAESEVTDFRRQRCRIRARELSGPNPRSRTFGASGADPSLRMEFSGGRPAGRIQVEKIFWWSAGGAHPSGKDFLGAGKTKWVTNSISKSDHMASDMCI